MSVPWPKATDKSETYLGSCHCGAICFRFTLSPPLYSATDNPTEEDQYPVTRCNCSMCTKNGNLSIYPLASDLIWLNDSDKNRKQYSMGSGQCPHSFCGNCGSSIGADLTAIAPYVGGEKRFSLNARMIKDIDLDRLKYKDAKGADMQPAYKSPV